MNIRVNYNKGLHSCNNVYNFPLLSLNPIQAIQINNIIYQVTETKHNEPLIRTILLLLLYANHSNKYNLCLLDISGIYKYELTKKHETAITNILAILSGFFTKFYMAINP